MNCLDRVGLIVFLLLSLTICAQTTSDYDALVQKGNAQLQAGHADLALSSGQQAIKTNADRWEGYALAGGALMNLKRYEEAADKLSEAINRAPEAKQAGLRDLRKQCLLAEAGAAPSNPQSSPASTTQAEIVLWKSIENSPNAEDFQTYLKQYPQGAFVALAQRHLADLKLQAENQQAQLKAQAEQQREKEIEAATWKDASTGLMWQRQKSDKYFKFADATHYCESSSAAGLSGWRLPTIDELAAIYLNKPNSVFTSVKTKGDIKLGWGETWTGTPGHKDASHIVIVGGRRRDRPDKLPGYALCVRSPAGNSSGKTVSAR